MDRVGAVQSSHVCLSPSAWPQLEQLALMLRYRPTTGILMLWLCGDDSRATHASGRVALGAGVATLENWCHLFPAWESVVKESAMGWFRATEWRSRETELRPYWQRLIEAMRDCHITPIGCVVEPRIVRLLPKAKAYFWRLFRPTVWEQQWIAFHTDPLSFSLTWCIHEGLEVLRAQSEDQMAMIFSRTAKLLGRYNKFEEILSLMPRQPRMLARIGPTTFAPSPRELSQLQVADLVAYELTAHDPNGSPRWQYEALLAIGLRVHVADRARLAPLWEPE